MLEDVFGLPDTRFETPQIYAPGVAAALENAIIYGKLPAGFKLTEEDICQKMGVSRSPVREALRVLEQDGLVVRVPRRGVRVSEQTVEELDELYVCRVALETAVVRLVVQNASDREIREIAEAHSRCEEAFSVDDVEGHFRANVQVSQLLFAASKNRPLVRLLGTIHKQALRYRLIAYKESRAIRENSIKHNAKLLTALVSRDPERAAEQARLSIESTHEVIRTCLLNRNARGTPARNG